MKVWSRLDELLGVDEVWLYEAIGDKSPDRWWITAMKYMGCKVDYAYTERGCGSLQ